MMTRLCHAAWGILLVFGPSGCGGQALGGQSGTGGSASQGHGASGTDAGGAGAGGTGGLGPVYPTHTDCFGGGPRCRDGVAYWLPSIYGVSWGESCENGPHMDETVCEYGCNAAGTACANPPGGEGGSSAAGVGGEDVVPTAGALAGGSGGLSMGGALAGSASAGGPAFEADPATETSSPDCGPVSTFELVTDSADFVLPSVNTDGLRVSAFAYRDSIWLISGTNYNQDNNYVYTSEDGISWTLVTDSADFVLPSVNTDGLRVSAFAYRDSIWLISGTNYSQDFNYVYRVPTCDAEAAR